MTYKLLAATAVAIMALGTAQAQEHRNNVGCGLGSVVFEGQSGTAQQSLAVTTNGTSSNQTFAISSGTSGCARDGVVDPPAQTAAFTDANLTTLARDAARGEGESLESLAELMGIGEQHKYVFFQTTQRNFSTIFASENATANDVLVAWRRVMAEDEVLSRYADV